jgi:transposase
MGRCVGRVPGLPGTHQLRRSGPSGLDKRSVVAGRVVQRVRAIPTEKGMAMTIVESCLVTGGVDTHLDVHVAAALNAIGGVLGVEEFPTTPAGYRALLAWLRGFGPVGCVGVEGTGSYGAGLSRYLHGVGVVVIEVNRADRQARRRHGKSDPLDALSAARAAQSGRARALPKGGDGQVEAIRVLLVAKRSARRDRAAAINRLRGLLATGPDDLRARFAGHPIAALIADTAALRPRAADPVAHATRVALRELGRRAMFLDHEIARLDDLLVPLVTARAGPLLAVYGVGPDVAAILLVAAGDHPERLRSEAAWAHLCGVAPIPASSGKITRRRLNPAGDRQANHALWRIALVRMGSDPRTKTYVTRRSAEGKSKPEILRCLKRYIAREVYPLLRQPD